MKIGMAAIILETNSFSPMKSDEEYFKKNGFLLHGNSVIDYHKKDVFNEIAGFLDIANKKQSEVLPSLCGWAVPYGTMPKETYKFFKETILNDFEKNIEELDGIYLALHGSMVVEDLPDPEGDLIESVRKIIDNKLLVVSLDYHANVTKKMAEYSSIIVSYNSFPHNNLYETGQISGTLFHKYVNCPQDLETWYVKLPLITALENMTIEDNPPMKNLINLANEYNNIDGVCFASVFGVQPWNDVPELGSSIVVVVEKRKSEIGKKYCSALAKSFWDEREYYNSVKLYEIDEAIKIALSADDFTVLLNEPSDNVGSGATGDSSTILNYLIKNEIKVPTILTICDPQAVKKCLSATVGDVVNIHVGGYYNKKDPGCEVTGTLKQIHDGVYHFRGPVQTGVKTSIGKSVVIEFNDQMFVQISEIPPYTIDPEHYICMGLHPERMKLVGIKSQGSYKASYDEIPHKALLIDSEGLSSSNMEKVPFTKVNKSKTFPFNLNATFDESNVLSFKR